MIEDLLGDGYRKGRCDVLVVGAGTELNRVISLGNDKDYLAPRVAYKLNLKGPAININTVGFIIVGLFVATWLIALAIWRFARIEERWSIDLAPPAPGDPS